MKTIPEQLFADNIRQNLAGGNLSAALSPGRWRELADRARRGGG